MRLLFKVLCVPLNTEDTRRDYVMAQWMLITSNILFLYIAILFTALEFSFAIEQLLWALCIVASLFSHWQQFPISRCFSLLSDSMSSCSLQHTQKNYWKVLCGVWSTLHQFPCGSRRLCTMFITHTCSSAFS